MNALAKTHPPFTSAEFYRLLDRGAFGDLRVELRGGMIVKMSPKYYPHGMVQDQLTTALKAALKAAGLQWLVFSEISVSFGNGFEPLPDLVVFDPDLVADKSGPLPPSAVKLIVEIADSTLADDLGEKREDYARAGLAEYWVADVNGKKVIRHSVPQGATYVTELPTAISAPLAMLTASNVVAQVQ